jgi:hypothetical protein
MTINDYPMIFAEYSFDLFRFQDQNCLFPLILRRPSHLPFYKLTDFIENHLIVEIRYFAGFKRNKIQMNYNIDNLF